VYNRKRFLKEFTIFIKKAFTSPPKTPKNQNTKTLQHKMDNILTGREGENYAAEYLEKLGWTIEIKNFYAAKGEIDIIAWKNERVLVFVEVKTRRDDNFGKPQEVTSKKQEFIARAAGAFMHKIGHEGAIRFDVIAVILKNGELRSLEHIEDAFFPGI
jgi:putative endonuclease